jgi:hypothetical protein
LRELATEESNHFKRREWPTNSGVAKQEARRGPTVFTHRRSNYSFFVREFQLIAKVKSKQPPLFSTALFVLSWTK